MPKCQTRLESTHGATLANRNAALGDVININQRSCRIHRIPVVDYDGGRYAITYLSKIRLPPFDKHDAYGYRVFYYRSSEPFTPELPIDGYPAKIDIYEQRSVGFGLNYCSPWTFTTEEFRVFCVTVQIDSTQLLCKL